jgi:hypothetical protein
MFLLETHPDVPLDIWNRTQRYFWMELVTEGLVERNDAELFFIFGAWFHQFYGDTSKFPTFQQVKDFITTG